MLVIPPFYYKPQSDESILRYFSELISNVNESKLRIIFYNFPKLSGFNFSINILKKLNGKRHKLISSVCISKNGSMIWNVTDESSLKMKELNLDEIKAYLTKIRDKELYAYGVYQIEADGRSLFSEIKGDEDTIMGLPIKQIKEYLKTLT